MLKIVQTTAQLHLSHTLAKWCSKFSKSDFDSMRIENLLIFKMDFKKAEEPDIRLSISFGSYTRQYNSRKASVCLIDYATLTVWITINCGKFWKRWKYHITWPVSWEICMQVKNQQLELDMEQQTGSKLGKEYVKAVYCYPPYLTYMQSTSCEIQGWL